MDFGEDREDRRSTAVREEEEVKMGEERRGAERREGGGGGALNESPEPKPCRLRWLSCPVWLRSVLDDIFG